VREDKIILFGWRERERERHAYVGKNENFKERIIQ